VPPGEAYIVMMAGFDPRRGCGFGYVYSSDGEARELKVGETVGPAPDPDDPAAEEIRELWSAASRGRHVERLHGALFDQQLRAMAAGRLALGVAVGGDLHHIEISAGGMIHYSTAPSRAWAGEAAA